VQIVENAPGEMTTCAASDYGVESGHGETMVFGESVEHLCPQSCLGVHESCSNCLSAGRQ